MCERAFYRLSRVVEAFSEQLSMPGKTPQEPRAVMGPGRARRVSAALGRPITAKTSKPPEPGLSCHGGAISASKEVALHFVVCGYLMHSVHADMCDVLILPARYARLLSPRLVRFARARARIVGPLVDAGAAARLRGRWLARHS